MRYMMFKRNGKELNEMLGKKMHRSISSFHQHFDQHCHFLSKRIGKRKKECSKIQDFLQNKI